MKPSSRMSPLFGVCAVLATAFEASAADDVLIVPRPTPVFAFPAASLLANDGECSPIESLSLPSRGGLESAGGGWLTYEPAETFLVTGADGFHYANACGELATVTLVADLKVELLLRGPVDAPLDPLQWNPVGDVELSCPSPPGCRLGIGYASGEAAFVETPQPQQHGTAHGGNTAVELDPGNGPNPLLPAGLPPGAEVHLFSAVEESGEPVFEVALAMGPDGPEVIARGRHGLGAAHGGGGPAASWSGTAPLPLPPGPQRIELNWWPATEPGLPAGGAILVVDGELSALTELDNHDLEIDRWVFGARSPPPGVDGWVWLENIQIWGSPESPVFPPLFRDDFEMGDLSLESWSDVSGPGYLAVLTAPTGGARLEVTVPPAASAFAADFSPAGKRHYRARFNLIAGTGACAVALAGSLTVFEALAADALHGFSIEIRQEVDGGLEVCAAAVLDGGAPAPLPDCAPLPAGRTSIEIQGWAAANAEPDGGLRLWLNGELMGQVLGLDNSLALVEQALLGAIGAPATATGKLCFDDFESWR